MDSSIRAEKIKPLHMRCSWTARHRWRCAHRHFFILPCLTTSYWCITNTLGKWWKMAVDQNPGTGYPSLHTKMTRPCAFIILLSSFHPFIPLCDWPVSIWRNGAGLPPMLSQQQITMVVPPSLSSTKREPMSKITSMPVTSILAEKSWGEPGLLGWSYRTYIVENKIH